MHHHVTVVLAGAAAHYLTGWVLNCDMLLGKIWKHEKDKKSYSLSQKKMSIPNHRDLVGYSIEDIIFFGDDKINGVKVLANIEDNQILISIFSSCQKDSIFYINDVDSRSEDNNIYVETVNGDFDGFRNPQTSNKIIKLIGGKISESILDVHPDDPGYIVFVVKTTDGSSFCIQGESYTEKMIDKSFTEAH